MIYGSICSGIEAASVAWAPLGWQPAWFAEIEPFASAALNHYHPQIPNHGDFTTIDTRATPVELLVGGTPCQSFSIAGQRDGLDDARGNLAIEFCRLGNPSPLTTPLPLMHSTLTRSANRVVNSG